MRKNCRRPLISRALRASVVTGNLLIGFYRACRTRLWMLIWPCGFFAIPKVEACDFWEQTGTRLHRLCRCCSHCKNPRSIICQVIPFLNWRHSLVLQNFLRYYCLLLPSICFEYFKIHLMRVASSLLPISLKRIKRKIKIAIVRL